MKVWDLHCDTLSELRKAEHVGRPKSFAQNDLHIDLEKLQKGDYLLQCFAAFVNLGDKMPGADPLVTVQAHHGGIPGKNCSGVHGGGHPPECCGGKDQRDAHHRGRRLLQGQCGGAAPDV